MEFRTFFEIVVAIAWAQGALLLAVHLFRRDLQRANILFALLLLAVLAVQSVVTLQALEPNGPHRQIYLAAFPIALLTGGLLYLYTVSVLYPSTVTRKVIALHTLVPTLFGTLWQIAVPRIFGPPEILADGHPALEWTELARVTAVTIIFGSYLAAAGWRLMSKQPRPSQPTYQWLRFFLAGFFASWLFLFFSNLLGFRGEQWLWVAISHTLIVMGFGFYSLKHSSLVAGTAAPNLKVAKPIDPAKRDNRIQLLEQLMKQEKLFTKPGLKLSEIADGLGLRVQETSELINQGTGMSFYEYVNRHRVEEVKRRMAAEECRHMSILAIALDCGFNSKSVFNEAFKEFEGTTPSEYRKNLGGMSHS